MALSPNGAGSAGQPYGQNDSPQKLESSGLLWPALLLLHQPSPWHSPHHPGSAAHMRFKVVKQPFSFFFLYQDEHMLGFSILLIWNSKSDHTEACQPQSSIQGYSRNCLSTCSILLWIWHERTEGKEWHQTDAHKVSNICLANLDFTGKAKKKKEGLGGRNLLKFHEFGFNLNHM